MKNENVAALIDRTDDPCYSSVNNQVVENKQITIRLNNFSSPTTYTPNTMAYKELVKNLENKVHKLSYIHKISHNINSMQNIDDLLNYALKEALEALEAESGSIFLWNADSKELELSVSKGRIDQHELKGIKKRLGEGITGLVARDGKPVLVRNIKEDVRFNTEPQQNRYKTDSFLCVPLFANNKLIGVINVSEKNTQAPFDYDDLEFLHILANHAAIAIDNMELYVKVKRFNDDLKIQVSRATSELQNLVQESLILKKYKENILESLSKGIFVIDKEGIVTLWNRGMELHYAIQPTDALGKKIADVLNPVNSANLIAAISRVFKEAIPINIEKEKYKSVENTVKYVNYNIFPLFNDYRKIIGVVVLHEDITEKLEMEKELRISERLALVGKLASGIAHELNNPLDGTRRYLNLSLDQIDTTNQTTSELAKEYLLCAKEGINRMIRIVRSLLEFSRQTSHAKPRSIEVNFAIEEALKLVSLKQPLAGIAVEKKYGQQLPPVVDYSLQNVFSNVIANAIDAMEGKEEGTLSIETKISDCESDSVEIIIEDTGSGINEEHQEHIFDPFFTLKKNCNGTGLGLAICHEIIKRSNGTIRVKSEVNKGTCFIITIPFSK